MIFYGSIHGVTSTKFVKIEKSWEEFCASLEKPKKIDLSVDEYHKLDKKKKLKIKDGKYILPCRLKSIKEGTRELSNCRGINFFALDLDEGLDLKRLDALVDYDWVLHSTLSYTPENCRYHLFVRAIGSVKISQYLDGINEICKLLGITSNKESKVPNQPMFLPMVLNGGEFMFKVNQGVGFDIQNDGKSIANTSEDDASLGIEDIKPVLDISDNEAKKMLSMLDPDCDLSTWIRICGAIKHQYYDRLDEGYELFKKFSSGELSGKECSKFEDGLHDGCRKTWNSLKIDRIGGSTFASIVHMVKNQTCNLPEWAQPYVYVDTYEKFYNTKTGVKESAGSINLKYRRFLPKKITPASYLINKVENVVGCISLPYNRKVKEITLAGEKVLYQVPNKQGLPLVRINGTTYFNLYKPPPFSITTKKLKNLKYVEKTYLNHLDFVMDKDSGRRFMDFLCYPIQNPPFRVRWATVLQGSSGLGKSFFGECLRDSLGPWNVRLTEFENVISTRFTADWALGFPFVVIEEAKGSNVRDTLDLMNKLQIPISNDTIDVRRIYEGSQTEINITTYLLLTEFKNALILHKYNRRYHVIFCLTRTQDEIEELTKKGYYVELHDLHKKYPEELFYLFNNWEISSDFSPDGVAPNTDFEKHVIQESKPEFVHEIEHLIKEGKHIGINEDFIVMPDLYSALLKHIHEETHDFNFRFREGQLKQILTSMGYYRHTPKLKFKDRAKTVYIHENYGSSEGIIELTELL